MVEDEPVLRRLVGNFLRAEGYTVDEADSVEGAKRIITTELIDLIVADFGLGAGTATDLYQWLVDKYPRMKSRFIVVSGWPDLDGFPYFLSKPFRLTDLIAIIKLATGRPPADDYLPVSLSDGVVTFPCRELADKG